MTRATFSTQEERVTWLLAHPEFLALGERDYEWRRHAPEVVSGMKRDGLVSRKTYWPDVNLKDAIREARIRWYSTHKC